MELFFTNPLDEFKARNTPKNDKQIKFCKCSICQPKYTLKHNTQTHAKNTHKINANIILQIIILAILTATLIYLISILPTHQAIQEFNPYTILKIDETANSTVIHHSFRSLSRIYHPDLNINDPEAQAKYMEISKAFTTLTDPVLLDNWKRFRNPDGPGTMKYKIGLPEVIMKKENELVVLSIFFIFLLLVIPSVFLYYYKKQQGYAINGVSVYTIQLLNHFINDGTRVKKFPEIFARTAESSEMSINDTDKDDLKRLMNVLVDTKKGVWAPKVCMRNYFILMAHLQRYHTLLSPKLLKVLNHLLSKSILIIKIMIEIAISQNYYLTVKAIFDFQRCLIQAIDFHQSSLLQIPHFNESVIKHIIKGKKGKNIVKSLESYKLQSQEERKGLNNMSDSQMEDIEHFLEHVSHLEIDVNVNVEDEDFIVTGDFVTCTVKLTRRNLLETQTLGPIHAPYFPDIKSEQWWIIITDEKSNILAHTVCTKLGKEVEEQLQFEVKNPGKNTIYVEAICDSYLGIDKQKTVDFYVHNQDQTRKLYVHPEDAKLDDEPTLFQKLMGDALLGHSSDEENEENDDDEVEDYESNDEEKDSPKDSEK